MIPRPPVALAVAAALAAACSGITRMSVPLEALSEGEGVSSPIDLVTSGQVVQISVVTNTDLAGNRSGYAEVNVLPSGLENVTLVRRDTVYGADVSMEAVASEPKIRLWHAALAAVAGWIGRGAVAP